MSRKCVMQIYMDRSLFSNNNNRHCEKIKGYSSEFLNASSVLAKKYAERTGADYVFLRDNPVININHPVNEKLQLLMPMWTEKYDQILYLDSDVFCWPEAPDLFEICPPNTFAVSDVQAVSGFEFPKMNAAKNIKKYFGINIKDKNTEGISKDKTMTGNKYNHPLYLYRLKKYCYFNSGVFMVGGREVGDEMMRHMNRILLKRKTAEAVLNFMVAASKVEIFEFSEKFNYTNIKHDKEFGYFYHAQRYGSEKEQIYKVPYERALNIIGEL